jgi:hypothetical protein
MAKSKKKKNRPKLNLTGGGATNKLEQMASLENCPVSNLSRLWPMNAGDWSSSSGAYAKTVAEAMNL